MALELQYKILEVAMKDRMKILFAYDGSECADAALGDLMRAGLPLEAQITVLSVAENWLPPPASLELLEGVNKVQEFKVLANRAAVRLFELNPDWEVKTEVLIGSPATLIIEKAREADLIVVGSHGRTALGRFFFGSVSQKILHEAHCSVRIARRQKQDPEAPVRIIIGIDGSRYANEAVRGVASRNWPKGSEVRLVNGMWSLPAAAPDHTLKPIADWITRENARVKEAIDSAFTTLRLAGLRTSVLVRDEEPKGLLCSEAEEWDADSIFIGSRGLSGIERVLMGSVSSGVAARARCSVEVIRVPE
jgi:nucleotide-binding universal stress UspA family protein